MRRISMKWLVFSLILALLLTGAFVGLKRYFAYQNEPLNFVRGMGAGINLGNTLDAHGKGTGYSNEIYETYWGNPVTTRGMISAIKSAGFGTVRIPVTWYEHLDANNVIDPLWLDRVSEVVDYVLAEDMYAILNLHHDDWVLPTEEVEAEVTGKFCSVWQQLALHFAAYDDHLLFEAINECRLVGTDVEWTAGNEEAREVVNHYNQAFVDTVRSCGGNNETRYLLIAPYCNSASPQALTDFLLPDDRRLIVSIHEYIPYNFALRPDGVSEWSPQDEKDTQEIDAVMASLHDFFTDRYIPVIITEFGAANRDNLKARLLYTEYFVTKARANKVMCIWWDEGSRPCKNGRFEIFDRYQLTFKFPEIAELLTSLQSA